ncbi:MAG: hypothetical protein ACOY0T_09500 [Myxococcota bacterium]
MIGKCKLCLKEQVELRYSHILPRWSHKRARGANSPPVMISDGKALYSSEQIAEYMLCDDCEQLLCHHEKYASVVSYQSPDDRDARFLDLVGPVVGASDEGFRIALPGGLDTGALVFFAVSVFWRASVSNLVTSCDCGIKTNESIRRFLLGEAFPTDATLIVSFVDVPLDSEGHIATMCSTPVSEETDGIEIHRFTLFGLWFCLFVGKSLPGWATSYCAATTPERYVALAPQTALVDWIGSWAFQARPVGTLAKQGR